MVKLRDSKFTWPIQKFLRSLGLAVHPLAGTLDGQLIKIIDKYEIENFVDIGAHEGEWAKRLDRLGLELKLFAIEPSSQCFNNIIKANRYRAALQVALSSRKGTSRLWETGSVFASLKKDLKTQNNSSEEVELDTLDAVSKNLPEIDWARSILKIDVQGSELDVLIGAKVILKKVPVILIECGLNPRYKGASTLSEISNFLALRGFEVAAIATDRFNVEGTEDCDAIFVNKNKSPRISNR